MEKQTLTFTALPNGFGANGAPRLSVFIAVRLWSDTGGEENLTLDRFPDLLHWPSRVSALAWGASVNGGVSLPLSQDSNPLNPLKPELWAALFRDTTQVKPFRFKDFRGISIETFPIWSIYETIASVYGRASSDSAYGAGGNRPDLGALAEDSDLSAIARPSYPEPEPTWNPPQTSPAPFPDAPPVVEKPEPQERQPRPKSWLCRLLFWLFCLLKKLLGLGACVRDGKAPTSPEPPTSKVAPTPSFKTDVTPPAAISAPAPGKGFLPPPLTPAQQQTRAAFDALDVFLKPFEGTEKRLPDAAALREKWDFHQAISSLGDYPAILRRLGLVLDFLLPIGTVLPAAGTIQITPTGAAWQTGTTVVTPKTHFITTTTLFMAAPRTVKPEISNGFLMVNDAARFRVIQNDVVGDAVKLRNAATHFLRFAKAEDRPGNMPGEGGLPGLRTTGISLIRRDTTEKLAAQFLRSCALNRFLAMQDLSPEPQPVANTGAPPTPSDELYAEDLVRGYRIDVFDTKTAKWRSLSERRGEYRFLEAPGGPALEKASDEGFVQFAATTSMDPAVSEMIRTSESLFTWSGWSLAAPRPGKYIMPDDSHADRQNPAVTQFKIETNFTAKPASLPRLRFGRSYRLRARMVDLACNSVTEPDDRNFQVDLAEKTEEFAAVRYEPIAPPIVMLQEPSVEGEALERMVVRTPTSGDAVTASSRHVAPPKVSQLLAELHCKFDIGGVDGSSAGYALASRESNSINAGAQKTKPGDDGIWYQPADHLAVEYLPDPQARGAVLTGVAGALASTTIPSIKFDGVWPNLLPFRIDLKAVADSPAVPTWDPVNRALMIELSPAQRATARINCLLDPGDLDSRGVWKWTEEQAPANLADVENSLLAGQHWAHMPWREITFLHAVQKPLAAPNITTVVAQKEPGQTFTTIVGSGLGATGLIAVDAPSTGRVQLLASWIDPIDDPSLPAPSSQTQNAHVCEIEVPEGVDPVPVIDAGTKSVPKHEFHDTKYHRVDYTPVAITRFREYFPAETNTTDATTSRGAKFSVDTPNSLRPATPKFLYALPLFEWSSPPGTAGTSVRTREGGGLRIYLDRPWYSSGDGELLGVVFVENADFLRLSDSLKPLTTVYAADPIWGANPTPVSAQRAHFKGAEIICPPLNFPSSGKLTLDEHPFETPEFSVAGYKPVFDPSRQLWRVDVRIDTGETYWPFVRLALARFQPKSVNGAHLSRVFQSDFIQLPPRRQTIIDVKPDRVHITVDGPVYFSSELTETLGSALPAFGGSPGSNGLSEIEAVIEKRESTDDQANELAWKPVDTTRATFFQNPAAPGKWDGNVMLSGSFISGLFRLKVKELEWYRTDDAASFRIPREEIGVAQREQICVARRVVFADVFLL
jgi:hypothetical protein